MGRAPGTNTVLIDNGSGIALTLADVKSKPMPQRLVFSATFMPTYMADHYIRIYPKKR